jgi:hypothetical protein
MPPEMKRSLFFALMLVLAVLTAACGKNGGVTPKPIKEDFWVKANGPYGGWATVLSVNSSGHVLAGTNNGGIYRPVNSADSWAQVNTGLISEHISAFAIIASGHIFAGTQGDGVCRSARSSNWVL